MHFRRISAKI